MKSRIKPSLWLVLWFILGLVSSVKPAESDLGGPGAMTRYSRTLLTNWTGPMWKHALGTNIFNPAHFLVTDETNISLIAPFTGPQGTNIFDPTQFVLTDGTNVHIRPTPKGTNWNFYGATTNFGTLFGFTWSESDVIGLVADLALKEDAANKGIAGGYASLDGTTKVPIAQIPTGATSTTVPFGNDARFSDARTPTAHTHPESDVVNLSTDLAAKEATANKGTANGYASLDSGTKIPIAQLPTGTSSSTVTIGNDSRLSDARTPTVHNVLDSTKHGDVLTGSIARGDLLVGNSTPKIAKFPIGAAGKFLRSDGTDPSYQLIAESDVTSLAADLTARELTANKAAASGYASLDSGTKVPIAQIPTIPWTLLSGVVTNQFNTNQFTVSGTTNISIKDGVLETNLVSYTADLNPVRFNAASQKVRLYGYVDAARGSVIDAIDPTETNYYGKLTLNGSSLIFQAGGITRSSIDSVETLFYNTYTNPTNYEAFSYQWSGNQFYMSTAAGSSGGTERHLNIRAGLTGQLKLGANDVDAIVTINTNSFVGINTLGPDRRLDILDSSNPQIRLTYTDSSAYTDLKTDVSGNLTITPSGLSTFNTGTFYTSVKMGIGMATTPSSLLEVNGANSSGIATITLTGTTASGGSNTLDFKRSGGTVNAQVTSIASGANDAAIIQFNTRNLAGTLAPRVTIDTEGNLKQSVGAALSVPSGTGQRAGNATLVLGTKAVACTSITANSIVLLTRKTSGGTLGTAITYTLNAGTGFVINSDSALDTSTFSYFCIEVP